MSETREQWLPASRCAGCPHLRHDTPYFGYGPTFSCENHNMNEKFFEESLHGVRNPQTGEVLYRSCCADEATK